MNSWLSEKRTSLANFIEENFKAAGGELALVRGRSGRPLLILHDELGYPGWMTWNRKFAPDRTMLIPLHRASARLRVSTEL
jgi:hypothetical protein